jgi:hypothetical protein
MGRNAHNNQSNHTKAKVKNGRYFASLFVAFVKKMDDSFMIKIICFLSPVEILKLKSIALKMKMAKI